MPISWELPPLRPGMAGIMDRFVGPGATPAEKAIQTYPPLFFSAGLVAVAMYMQADWTFWQYAIAAILAMDLLGGVITNATAPAKRWYFRAGQGFARHMGFVAIHVVQIGAFGWAFLGADLNWIAGVYTSLLISGAIILKTPLYLRRPVAMLIYCLCLVLSLYVFASAPLLEWFLPMLFLKLLICHLVQEEPYRPDM